MLKSRAVPLFAAVLLLVSGCGSDSSTPPAPATTEELSWEAFLARAYQEPETGVYIANGDETFENLGQLREYYESHFRRSELGVMRSELSVMYRNGARAVWNNANKLNITYCVSTAFGSRHSTVVSAMADAAAAWEAAAHIDFIHASSYDGNCNSGQTGVVFDVNPVNSGSYLARAFFPDQSRSSRNVLIDATAFSVSPPLTLIGILRHELGHALGFRHEHTRPEAGTCFEDNQWQPLTSYDPYSVMHYPQCNGRGDWSLHLTALDKAGAQAVYGLNLFSNPIHIYPAGWDFGNPSPWETIVGDFNGDGRTDYGRLGGTYSHFFFSRGDGTFSNPIHTYPTGWDFGFGASWPNIVGDFNGDGRTDYARLGGTYSHFFFSRGDGTFSNLIHTYPAGWDFGNPSPWETIVGDFNGDGRTDYGRLGGTYSHFFFSQGDGTFSNPIHTYPAGWDFGNPSPWKTIVGDFNGDGRTDYGRLGGTYSHFFFSRGDGTFSNPIHTYPAGWDFGFSASWPNIVGDFNGDGRTDYARLGGTYSHFFFSRGDGTFSNPIHTYPAGWDFGNPSPWKTIVGDFNGDGRTDYGRLGGTYSHFFFSQGDGTFSNPIHTYPTGWDFGFGASWPNIVGDFNGDGRTDYARLGGTYSHFFLKQ